MLITKEDISQALMLIQAAMDTVKARQEIPSGHLYAALMPYGISLTGYQSIEGTILRTGLVEKKGDLLKWKEGKA